MLFELATRLMKFGNWMAVKSFLPCKKQILVEGKIWTCFAKRSQAAGQCD